MKFDHAISERENVLRVITRSDAPQWVPCGPDCLDVINPADVVRERPAPEEGSGHDWFGCYWHFDPATMGFTPIPGRQPVKNIVNWRDEVCFPDIDAADWAQGAKVVSENVDREEKVSYFFWESGPWERLHALLGFEEALLALYTEPESVLELMEAITLYKLSMIDRIAEYYQPDIVCNLDDFAHQKNLFMSVEMLNKFVLPFEKRIFDALHRHGIICSHHSCGKIDSIIGEILETGPEIITGLWAPYNDIETVEKQYAHRFTVDGGMDMQLIANDSTTEEMLVLEVRRCIDQCAPYKNLIANPGPVADPTRAEILINEIRSYGHDYWKRM
ncbi:MAG: hypothetical protein LBO74_01470 [Candidatus Symbiothrix sp.]|jgi:hypothetical protein|nr:hypothetical protein [Candidatus Symbiothrix sp.]